MVLGWAASYTYFSLNSAWGDQPIDFFLPVSYTHLPNGALLIIVGFANSSFEVLAGIGVFAALGFIATAQGVEAVSYTHLK